MKYLILIPTLLMSLKTYSKEENLSGCQRYDAIHESLNNGCSPTTIKLLLDRREALFEETLFAEKENGNSLVGLIKKASSDKDITCKMANDITRPGSILIALAAKKSCDEALKFLSNKTSAKDFALAVYTPINNSPSFLEYVFQTASEKHEESEFKKAEEKVKGLFETLKVLVIRMDTDCKSGVKESCEGKQEVLKLAERITQASKDEEADEKYAESSESILDEACPLQKELERNQLIIKREKEIGKVSGTINTGNLNRAGAWIVDLKPRIAKLNKEYKNKTKKNINFKNCQD